MRSRAELICLAWLLNGGCAALDTPADYDRHHLSMLRPAQSEPGVYIFEARASGDYPPDSDAAENRRLEWLEEWLEIRGWCPDGYELIDRQPIDASDINLYHMDLRYRLKCVQPGR